MNDWWSPESTAQFEIRAAALANQYSEFEVTNGTFLNGNKTLGENIADNSGNAIAYMTYGRSFKNDITIPLPSGRFPSLNGEQVFFTSFAQSYCNKASVEDDLEQIKTDVHSLRKFRVLGVIQNSEGFGKAFQCREGDVYNPVVKNIVW